MGQGDTVYFGSQATPWGPQPQNPQAPLSPQPQSTLPGGPGRQPVQKPIDTTLAKSYGPQTQSPWTGVSSNNDPYGVANIGYKLPAGATRHQLLSLNAPQYNQVDPPSGPSQYENTYGSQAPGTSPADQNSALQLTNGLQARAAGYPSYPNAYGLGNSSGQMAPQSMPNSYASSGLTVNVPDTSARGLNPWSLQGEANARDQNQGVSTGT